MKKLFKKTIVALVSSEPNQDSKKAIWKFIIQTLISILTAILTALGAASCVNALG